MEETKQTNQNEEFNFGASKEIQDLILKTDNKILLAIIYHTARYVDHSKYSWGVDKRIFEIFEDFALNKKTKLNKLKKIKEEKQSEKEIRNLLQQYMETGDSDSLKKANKLKQEQKESVESLEKEIQEIERSYSVFTKVFNKTIKNLHSDNGCIFTMSITGRNRYVFKTRYFSFNKLGMAEIDLTEYSGIEDLDYYDFKEWKDIPFDNVLGSDYYEYFEEKYVQEERFNQLKENIRLQQAKNVGQTTNPRSAR